MNVHIHKLVWRGVTQVYIGSAISMMTFCMVKGSQTFSTVPQSMQGPVAPSSWCTQAIEPQGCPGKQGRHCPLYFRIWEKITNVNLEQLKLNKS